MSNRNNPLVSVIMPVYNHEKFIKKAICSLIEQNYINWELIVIDDGSTDSSANIIKSFKDPRIFYYYQKNKGVKKLAETLNKGLDICRGKFVTMLPSDDYWPVYRLNIQIPYFKNKKTVLVFGNMFIVDEKDNIIANANLNNNYHFYNTFPKSKKIHIYFKENYIMQPTVLIKTKVLKKIGGYIQPKYMYAEDYPTQMHLLFKGDFKFINKKLAYYRMHSDQMTKNHIKEMVETDIKFLREFYNSLDVEKKKLTGFSPSKLNIMLEKKLNNYSFYIGRVELFNKNKKEAKKHFFNGIIKGSPKIKIKSLIAIIFLYLNLDLELLARYIPNKVHYR
jgi:glycosyltransferase involved in cell wall biosynthesis